MRRQIGRACMGIVEGHAHSLPYKAAMQGSPPALIHSFFLPHPHHMGSHGDVQKEVRRST